jgi:hypothetical protein
MQRGLIFQTNLNVFVVKRYVSLVVIRTTKIYRVNKPWMYFIKTQYNNSKFTHAPSADHQYKKKVDAIIWLAIHALMNFAGFVLGNIIEHIMLSGIYVDA